MSVRARVRAVVDISAAEQVVHLAMRGDDLAARLHAEHRLAHESLALHSPAVVGKADDVGRELLDGGEFLPPLAHGERGVGVHPRLCGAAYRVLLLAKVRETVRDGTEIGHRKERRIARSRAALAPRRDALLIKKTRFPQMNVCVCKTGKDDFAVDLVLRDGDGGREKHLAVRHGHRAFPEPLCGIIYGVLKDEHLFLHKFFPLYHTRA